MHHQDAPDPLGLAGRDVEHARAGLELAGVDAEVGQLADERVGHDLEGQRREGLRLVGRARRRAAFGLAADRLDALHGRHVERRGQVVDDRVEQRLHALVLERGPAQHGREGDRERGLANRRLQQRLRDLGLLEDQLEELVVEVRDLLEQMLARGGGGVGQLGRDLALVLLGAEVVEVVDRAHLDQVDDAGEVALGADRQLDRHRVRAEAVDHRLHAAREVGADAVHLVDVGDPRDAVLVGLAPDRLRLGLDAGDRVK